MSPSNTDLYRDRELFKGIAQGDRQAFSTLFQAYSNPLYWHAFKLLHSEFWAEELVQDTFVQLWLKRSSLPDIGNPSAYLFRMVANKALDRIRRQALEIKMQYVTAHVLHNVTGEAIIEEDGWGPIRELLHTAVERLPDQRRRIYRLKYQEGFSYEEIAEKLSISRHTVRNHMVKALEDIRSFLLENRDLLLSLLYAIGAISKIL